MQQITKSILLALLISIPVFFLTVYAFFFLVFYFERRRSPDADVLNETPTTATKSSDDFEKGGRTHGHRKAHSRTISIQSRRKSIFDMRTLEVPSLSQIKGRFRISMYPAPRSPPRSARSQNDTSTPESSPRFDAFITPKGCPSSPGSPVDSLDEKYCTPITIVLPPNWPTRPDPHTLAQVSALWHAAHTVVGHPPAHRPRSPSRSYTHLRHQQPPYHNPSPHPQSIPVHWISSNSSRPLVFSPNEKSRPMTSIDVNRLAPTESRLENVKKNRRSHNFEAFVSASCKALARRSRRILGGASAGKADSARVTSAVVAPIAAVPFFPAPVPSTLSPAISAASLAFEEVALEEAYGGIEVLPVRRND